MATQMPYERGVNERHPQAGQSGRRVYNGKALLHAVPELQRRIKGQDQNHRHDKEAGQKMAMRGVFQQDAKQTMTETIVIQPDDIFDLAFSMRISKWDNRWQFSDDELVKFASYLISKDIYQWADTIKALSAAQMQANDSNIKMDA